MLDILHFDQFLVKIPEKLPVRFCGKVDSSAPLAIMGPSGCGKSTLLKTIAGLREHAGGRLLLNEKEIQGLTPAERNFSFVFQNPPFLPQYSVKENLYFPLKFLPESKAWSKDLMLERAEALLDKFDLSSLADKNPYHLSRGEQQRISLLRALINQPRLLLLDEPLSALDSQNKIDFIEWIKWLLKENKTITIMVTHDEADASALGSSIVRWQKNEDFVNI